MTDPIKLDVEAILRAARFRSSRDPEDALALMLFQELKKRDPATQLEYCLLEDPGRSLKHQSFAIRYQGDLWTVRGKGEWERQKELFLAHQGQTWKNPRWAGPALVFSETMAQQFAATDFPLLAKTQARLSKAMCDTEAKALGVASPKAAPRKQPRF